MRDQFDGGDSELKTHNALPATTSDEVQATYYGFPVIKAPHWRWLVITYFFFGALAGGSFTIASLADVFSRDRGLTRAARYISMAALLPSPVLLILDLGRPERFLNMMRIVKLRSPMSLGSWALAGLGLFASISTGLQMLADLTGREVLPDVRRIAGILGLPFALFISGYTGVLLAITNVPLWARNSLLLGPTFVASAFSTSISTLDLTLSLVSHDEVRERRIARAETISLMAEMAFLLAGMVRLGRLGRPLTGRPWGMVFWPFTFVGGLVVPLILLLTGPVRDRPRKSPRRMLGPILVIAGSYQLRMLMIFAGRESVNRPEDYFEYTADR